MIYGEDYEAMMGHMIGYFHGGAAPPMVKRQMFEYTEVQMREKAEAYIPTYMIDGIMGWVMDARIPGGFLEAVLKNDLMGAAAAADGENGPVLKGWVIFLHNFTPGGSHGSDQNYNEWFDIGGLNGMEKAIQSKAAEASSHYDDRDKETADEIRKRGDRIDEHAGE